MQKYVFFLLITTFVGNKAYSTADAIPFQTRNQNPLTLIYGLPLPTPAKLIESGQLQTNISLNISNTLNIEANNNELLFIDGESKRLNFIIDYGLNEKWSLRSLIPLAIFSGGFLDRPIERYHDLFDFDQGDRLGNPRNRLLFFYQRNGSQRLNVSSHDSSVGDIQFMLGRQLPTSTQNSYSFWTSIKLPTGNIDDLNGSGGIDISAWLAAQRSLTHKWQLYGNTGISVLGNSDFLPELQQSAALFGHFGAHWQTWNNIAIKAQLEWHTSLYKSTGAKFLGDVLQLTFGSSWQISDNYVLDFAIAEDIKTEASPDVNFNLTLRIKH